MKKTLSIVLTLLATQAFIFAQSPRDRGRHEEMEILKVGYLTRALELTSDEAKAFWPVYDEMQAEMKKVHKEMRRIHMEAKINREEMSDKDIEQMVDKSIEIRQRELDIQKKYHSKFKQVLPIEKVAKLYRAEFKFKRLVLQSLGHKKGEGRRGGVNYFNRR